MTAFHMPTEGLLGRLARDLEVEPARVVCSSVKPRGRELVETRLTLAQLAERVLRAMNVLESRGLVAGDRVVLSLAEPHDFLVWIVATLSAGMVAAPIPTAGEMTTSAAFVDRILGVCRDCAPRLAVIENRERWDRVVGEAARSIDTIEASACASGSIEAGRLPFRDSPLDHAAVLQYTSGSTGDPKGVVITHGNLVANLEALGVAARYTREDRVVSWLPLHHDMGLIGGLFMCLYWRMATYVMTPLVFMTRPVAWLQAIHQFRGTLAVGPTFAIGLCARKIPDDQLAGLDLSSWRLVIVGAEPIDADVLHAFVERFAPYGFAARAMFPVYGLAETVVAAAFPVPGEAISYDVVDRAALGRDRCARPSRDDGAVTLVSVGAALPGHAIEIVSVETGAVCRERELGEVVVSGPSVSPRYFSDPDGPPRQRLHTGDLGYLADGRLFLFDRVKDLVIVAGQNYSPSDIETALQSIPGIRRGRAIAFASGTLDGREALRIVAELDPRELHSPAKLRDEVTRRVRARLGLTPATVLLVPPGTLDKTTSGKLRRRATRDRFEAGTLPSMSTMAHVLVWRAKRFLGGLAITRFSRSGKVSPTADGEVSPPAV